MKVKSTPWFLHHLKSLKIFPGSRKDPKIVGMHEMVESMLNNLNRAKYFDREEKVLSLHDENGKISNIHFLYMQ